jgi:hypothetical protein
MRHVMSYENQGSARGAKRRDRHENYPWIFFENFLKPTIKKEYLEVKLTKPLIHLFFNECKYFLWTC